MDASTEENFSFVMPDPSAACMNAYLLALSKEFPEGKITLISDQAGWHKSKELVIPENIFFIYLPAYSPELNPIERLWLHIKQNILNNVVYETLEELEVALCQFMQSLVNSKVRSICNAPYLFH